ncbi:glycosyltransferase [Altererythrobacter soli]|uniref:Glycosyltransferase n=2 Tax=Croceibacterium soli TaxID=1739690 RepID=A0A6I4UT04_9SPHN|nr:glycosyltransferase [Croceibacterium soli]
MGGRHWHLARELAERGHQVHMIAARWHHLLRDQEASANAPAIERLDGVNFVRIPTPRYAHAHDRLRFLNWVLFAWRIANLPRQLSDRPDAIFYSSPSLIGTLGAERLARRLGTRLTLEVRDIWPLTLVELGGISPAHPLIRLMQSIEDRAYKRADAVVSNLPGAGAHMVARGMDPTKFHWIPNGFSLGGAANPVSLPAEVQGQLPKGKFVVGYAGTLGLANALDNLLAAAERLRERDDIAFVLVGDGREKARLQAEVRTRGLHNVTFLDPVPAGMVQSLLAEFGACFIGWNETPLYRFGIAANKIFDYLYSGRPIIHSYSGAYDPVAEYDAGLTVEAERPDALAEAILELRMMPPEKRQQLGSNGRRAVMERHEYGMLAGRLEEVLFGRSPVAAQGSGFAVPAQ